MVEETVAGWLAMPFWAQVGTGWFALAVVVMFAEPIWRLRRVTRRFAALAEACGATVTPGYDKFTASFEVEREGRRFTVRRELREGMSSGYRGPRGHLLISETPLATEGWQHHHVDIANDGAVAASGMRPFKTGDAGFDKRFTAWQGGQVVRPGWLDAATRDAVSDFFDAAPIAGSLWVRDGLLQYAAVAPKGVRAADLDPALGRLAAVARAFEQTAQAEPL